MCWQCILISGCCAILCSPPQVDSELRLGPGVDGAPVARVAAAAPPLPRRSQPETLAHRGFSPFMDPRTHFTPSGQELPGTLHLAPTGSTAPVRAASQNSHLGHAPQLGQRR
uniref:ORF3 n=1 Tax=Rocahepevirus ratti TaxID=1678145 RepID=A0A2P1MBR8_9VIRU|nr:ORF3 [Rocahepevirus ratti]